MFSEYGGGRGVRIAEKPDGKPRVSLSHFCASSENQGGSVLPVVPGPIAQDDQEKKRRGNPGKRGRPKTESANNAASVDWISCEPTMPDWLSEEAKKHWREIVPLLVAKQLICELDAFVLAKLCSAYGRAVIAEKELATGLTRKVSGGNKQRKIEEKIAKDAWQQYYQDAEKFGLTPQARARMRLPRLTKATNAAAEAQEARTVFDIPSD